MNQTSIPDAIGGMLRTATAELRKTAAGLDRLDAGALLKLWDDLGLDPTGEPTANPIGEAKLAAQTAIQPAAEALVNVYADLLRKLDARLGIAIAASKPAVAVAVAEFPPSAVKTYTHPGRPPYLAVCVDAVAADHRIQRLLPRHDLVAGVGGEFIILGPTISQFLLHRRWYPTAQAVSLTKRLAAEQREREAADLAKARAELAEREQGRHLAYLSTPAGQQAQIAELQQRVAELAGAGTENGEER
jgi:hypothetical protein